MSDAFVLVVWFAIFASSGYAFTGLLPGRLALRKILAPVFGVAILSLVATLVYVWGLPQWIRTLAVFSLIFAGLVVLVLDIARSGVNAIRLSRTWIGIAGICIAAFLLLVLPVLIGGAQFTVFAGNKYDHFNYLKNGLVYENLTYAVVLAIDDETLLQNPVMVIAKGNAVSRPSIMILWGMLSEPLGGEALRLGVGFLAVLIWMVIPAFAFAAANLLQLSPVRSFVAGAVFSVGFWGQYILDLNAWSQVASVAVLIVCVVLVLKLVQDRDVAFDPKTALGFGVLAGGATYLYPEGTAFYIPGLGVVLLIGAWVARRWTGGMTTLTVAGVVALVLVLGHYDGTIDFVLRQFSGVVGDPPDWWRYFQAYLSGNDGWSRNLEANLIDFLAGLFGLYFLTPAVSLPSWNKTILRLLIFGLLLLVFGLAWRFYRKDVLARDSARREMGWYLLVFVGMSLLGIVPYLLQSNYWAAGKAYSFAVPFVFLILLAPLTILEWRPPRLATHLALWIFCLLQICFGMARLSGASSDDGVVYPYPYPAIQDTQDKTDLRWNLSEYREVIRSCRLVKIEDLDDPWPEDYAMMYLFAEQIPFFKVNPVHPAYGNAREPGAIGFMRQREDYDCLLALHRPGGAKSKREFRVWRRTTRE